MPESNNLLTALHKWAHRQDENFITDAFAHLLRHLLEAAPPIACEVLRLLIPDDVSLQPEECSEVTVTTQSPSETGTPDMTVAWGTSLLFIEAKVDSGFGTSQLPRYRKLLDKQLESGNVENGWLTTLTRRHVPDSAMMESGCRSVRWQTVVEHLDRLSDEVIPDPVTRHLIQQFTAFIRQRMIEMQQITPELTAGVASLRRMLEMINQSLKDQEISIHQKMSGWYKVGYWLNRKRWRVFISYRHPHVVVFETSDVPISELHKAQISTGEFHKPTKGNKRLQWLNRLDLNDNDGEFYGLSPHGQKDRLDSFIRTSVEIAQQIDRLNGTGVAS